VIAAIRYGKVVTNPRLGSEGEAPAQPAAR